jgi:hypothetical protein
MLVQFEIRDFVFSLLLFYVGLASVVIFRFLSFASLKSTYPQCDRYVDVV